MGVLNSKPDDSLVVHQQQAAERVEATVESTNLVAKLVVHLKGRERVLGNDMARHVLSFRTIGKLDNKFSRANTENMLQICWVSCVCPGTFDSLPKTPKM